MFASTISKEELRDLPTGQFKGNIHLIEKPDQVQLACNCLTDESVLGFDTETKPSFKKGSTNRVSLLQLSSSTDAYLFRLNKIGLPPCLVKLLSNPDQLKVGIAIRDDIRHLKALHPIKAEGFLELQEYVRQFGIENSGLSKLTGIILNFRVSKSQQLTNWENETLTIPQQLYAATDAWAAYEIYRELNEKRSNISSL
ncbi:MAG TPA: 3'-5' exonuclease [Bacteroidales bacterium]